MKKLLSIFTKKHNFIISKWETEPTAYGQRTLRSYATEYTCVKCGRRTEASYNFNDTSCK